MNAPCNSSRGFTLIELSIVLVIIGLIAGGVLVGRDLISAATIRASISQIERIKTGMKTFKLKYGQLPGDMTPAASAQFGMFAYTGANAGGEGMGNNDGTVEAYLTPCGGGPSSRTTIMMPCGEMVSFWRHMAEANLIEGTFMPDGSYNTATGTPLNNYSSDGSKQFFPYSKMGRNNMIRIYANAQRENWLMIGGVSGIGTPGYWGGPLASGSQYALTPIEVYQMDVKMDDGIAGSGSVKGGGSVSMVAATGVCGLLPMPFRYNLDPAVGGIAPACEAYFKAE